MKVSIITPTYNSIKYINELKESILSQVFTDWEWIIVDDLSTDGTIDYLKKLQETDSRIKCFFQDKNLGAGPSRNLAIENATGEYIAFLDSDDLWKPNKLKHQISFMDENKSVLSHTEYGFIDGDSKPIRKTFVISENPIGYKDLLKNTEIGCLTAVYSQKKLGKRFMSDLRRKQDYALWLSILKEGYLSHPIKESLALYRVHSDSATSKKSKLIIKHWIFLHKHEKLNWFQAFYYTCCWGYNGVIKHYLKR